MLQLDRAVAGGPAGEVFVIRQGLFQELLLKRVELLVKADVGDLGQEVDGLRAPAGPVPRPRSAHERSTPR